MLLQTNSYIVPSDKRAEHARLMRRFRQVLSRLGCGQFEVYEQVAPNFVSFKGSARFVQIMRFRNRKEQQALQSAERSDPNAQDLVREFCELVDIEYQKKHSLFAVGFYAGHFNIPDAAVLPAAADTPELSIESRDFSTADLDPAAERQAIANLDSKSQAPSEPHQP